MKQPFTSMIRHFVGDNDLPLHVVYRAPGQHPARFFHDHHYSEIAMIISGTAEHILDNHCERVSAGDILLIHPGALHAYDDTATMEIINLIYDPNRLSMPLLDSCDLPLFRRFIPAAGEYNNSAKPILKLSPEELATSLELIQRIASELNTGNPGRKFHITALFMQVLSHLSRIGSSQNAIRRVSSQIDDALSYINYHFQKPLEIPKLAKAANMSLRNFQRYFKSTTGCTPMEFVIQIRLRNAADSLINSDYPISMIALNCGFYDSNYFCKKFKEHFGISPKTFRLQHRN